jgi:hypothetical protein
MKKALTIGITRDGYVSIVNILRKATVPSFQFFRSPSKTILGEDRFARKKTDERDDAGAGSFQELRGGGKTQAGEHALLTRWNSCSQDAIG